MSLEQNSTLNSKVIITIGDEVELKNGLKGEVKFIGDMLEKGIFYGIELKENKGENDGSIDNKYYFKTKDKKKEYFFNFKILN